MKIAINILVVLFISWPTLVIGYIVAAIIDGYGAGTWHFDEHCRTTAKFFRNRDTK